MKGQTRSSRRSLYAEVTEWVIAELEERRLPWVQPWDAAARRCAMPANAVTGRRYTGINVLILWAAVIEGGYASQRWLTYRQAVAAGGHVRKGERGTTVCYADRFTPRAEAEQAQDEEREARTIALGALLVLDRRSRPLVKFRRLAGHGRRGCAKWHPAARVREQ